jgi:hypothetical protein
MHGATRSTKEAWHAICLCGITRTIQVHYIRVECYIGAIKSTPYIYGRGCLNQHFKILHKHMAMWLIYIHLNHISLWAKYRYKEKKRNRI